LYTIARAQVFYIGLATAVAVFFFFSVSA